MPQSPYLDRLLKAIEQATDPTTRGLRRADLAACWARHGDFEASEKLIADLRSEFGDGHSGRVSIMIMVAEAQLIYFGHLGEQARDRMMRAQLLSVAGRDAALSALTSAWLGHICFNLHRHEEMARCVKTALDTVSRGDNEAACRLALTLGDAFFAAEQASTGLKWYSKAHEHAVRLGDHATIGALTYNRAAMGTFMARVRAVDAPQNANEVARLAIEVRSAVNYQAIAQLSSLEALLEYATASVKILGGDFSDALNPLRKLAESRSSTSPLERSAVIDCDLAMCLAKTGQREEAALAAQSVSIEALTKSTADDRLVAFAALAETARICAMEDLLSIAQSGLSVARAEHRDAVRALGLSIAAFDGQEALERI